MVPSANKGQWESGNDTLAPSSAQITVKEGLAVLSSVIIVVIVVDGYAEVCTNDGSEKLTTSKWPRRPLMHTD